MRALPHAMLRPSCALLIVCAASAQEEGFDRIAVRVTAVQASRAYIDVGSDGGLLVGDRVQLFPAGRPTLECVVRGITRNSARIEWDGLFPPTVGTQGEALVPKDRASTNQPTTPLPWTQTPENFDPNAPLLAPAKGLDNAERESRFSGRWFTQGDWTRANVGGSEDYSLARTGLDLSLENPFGRGGALEFDGEIYRRSSSLWDSGDDTDTQSRIDQLSVWWGGVRGDDRRVEIGRFLQHEFPEFGVLDGAEVTWRTSGGDRYGVSAGLLPEVDPERTTGEDTAISAYYRYVVGEDEHAALGIGAQKTWHKGQADRDLIIVNGHWRAGQRWSLYASTWIDFYTADDTAKPQGPELTQAIGNLSYQFDNGLSLGLNASQFRWPELLRLELPPITSTTLSDGVVTRVGVSASKNVTKKLRLSGRIDEWHDQDNSGYNGELRAGLRDTLFERGEVSVSAFSAQGLYSDFSGLRLGAMRWNEWGSWRVDFEAAQAQQDDFSGSQADLLQYVARAGIDFALGSLWSLSLSAESRFGDEQDALAAGFFLQRRF
jgi:hypothetical protein